MGERIINIHSQFILLNASLQICNEVLAKYKIMPCIGYLKAYCKKVKHLEYKMMCTLTQHLKHL